MTGPIAGFCELCGEQNSYLQLWRDGKGKKQSFYPCAQSPRYKVMRGSGNSTHFSPRH